MRAGMTAEEARADGVSVPENVPDCAIFVYGPMEVGEVNTEDDGRVTVQLTLNGKWSWITLTAEIDGDEQ